MRRKKNRWRIVFGCVGFFALIAAIVTAALLVYSSIKHMSYSAVSGIMFGVVVLLAALCTAVDALRHKFTVDAHVDKIAEATERIAAGDFSVRLDIKHRINDFDDFDYIAENLNKMAAELSRTEVLHTDFISNVSHEIKTPLAIIQNYATSLQNKNLDDETRAKYAQTLVSASKKLTALITNILKLNKLENQEIKPERQTINLTEALAEVVLGYEELIESKGLELDCHFDEDVIVRTSPSYLEIVWNNLLSNAIKFTPDGGKISVSLKEEGGKAVVTVADTGCGISAETGKHIFEKFYQGDTSHSGEGNGLGLALVKKVIDVLGGTIEVNSESGKGSAFTVRLKREI